MEVIQWNPADIAGGNLLSTALAPQAVPGANLPAPPREDRGFGDAVVASFARDNWIASLANNLMDDAGANADATRDASFNPFAYINQNWDEARRSQARGWIHNGLFDRAFSAREVERIASAASRETELMERANASGAGSFIGGLAAAVVDPLSYLGVGTALRGANMASRVGRMTLQSGLSQAATEAALQQIQTLRTAHESILNVGGATLFGGGIGAVAEGLPRALRGALDTDLSGAGHTAPAPGGGNLSAAVSDFSLHAPAPTKAGGITILDRVLGGFRTPFADFTSPMYRVLNATSDVARNVGTRLADFSGTWLQHADGTMAAAPRSAEALRNHYQAQWFHTWENGVDSAVRTLSQHLAIKGARAMDPAEFMGVVARAMTERIDGELGRATREALAQRYGADNVDAVVSAARERAEALHKVNTEQVEPELVRRGIVRDTAQADKLRQQVEALRTRRDTEVATLQQQLAIARGTAQRRSVASAEARSVVPELEADLLAAREKWRNEIAPYQQQLDHQMSLPEPLGRDYRFAQLYDRQSVIANPEAFERILIDKFTRGHVDAEWLQDAYKLSVDDFRALETKDPTRHAEITRAWVGDERLAEIEKIERHLATATERSRLADADARAALHDLKLADRYLNDPPAKALQELVNLAENELAHLRKLPQTPENTAHLRVTEGRLDRLMQARNALTEADAVQKSTRSALQAVAQDVGKQRNLAYRNVRDLKAQLTKVNGRGGMYEAIQKIVDGIRNGDALPSIDKSLGQDIGSSRLRERRIHWTPEEIEELTAAGFLRDDLGNILHHQFNDLAGQVSLREAFDIGPQGRYKSWGEIDRALIEDYRTRIAAAPEGKARAALAQEEMDVRKSLEGMRRRLLHRNSPDMDRDSPGYWFSEKWRQFAFLRYGSGFGLASLTDLAALVLRHRTGDIVQSMGRDFIPTLRNLKNSELNSLIGACEMGLSNVSRARAESWIDMTGQRGIGARGTMRQRVTANIDVAMEKSSNVVAAISFLPLLTRSVKTIAANSMMNVLRREAGQFASLSAKRRYALMSLGLDESRAARLHEHFTHYGREADGAFDPRVELWPGPEGREALKDFQMALQRDMNLASPTPGIADTPLLMDSWIGRLLMQFQTFAFVTHNRMLAPALQRATVVGDFRGLGMLATAMPLAMTIILARDVINGRDPSERFNADKLGQTMMDLTDRMGLLGWLKPYLDASMKATGMDGLATYSRNNAWQSLGGIPIEQASRLNEFVSATAAGDTEKMRRSFGVLSPANTHMRLFMHLLTD